MKRRIAAGFAVLAVMGGVGWMVASQHESSARLEDVSLIKQSEHTNPGPTEALAGIRIRISPSDFDKQLSERVHEVPHIAVAGE